MRSKYNHRGLGFAIGFIAPLIILLGFNVYKFPDLSFYWFIKSGAARGTISPFLQLATLFNLAPFYLFVNKNMLRACQGIIFATIIYGSIIIYFVLT